MDFLQELFSQRPLSWELHGDRVRTSLGVELERIVYHDGDFQLFWKNTPVIYVPANDLPFAQALEALGDHAQRVDHFLLRVFEGLIEQRVVSGYWNFAATGMQNQDDIWTFPPDLLAEYQFCQTYGARYVKHPHQVVFESIFHTSFFVPDTLHARLHALQDLRKSLCAPYIMRPSHDKVLQDLLYQQPLQWALVEGGYETSDYVRVQVVVQNTDPNMIFVSLPHAPLDLLAVVPYHGGDVLEALSQACGWSVQQTIARTEGLVQHAMIQHGCGPGDYLFNGTHMTHKSSEVFSLDPTLAQTLDHLCKTAARYYPPNSTCAAVFEFYHGNIILPDTV